MSNSLRFIVWAHRNADSIFGAASNPVVRNGSMLTFDDEKRARVECAHLNARSNNNLHYSIKRTPVRRSANSSN
jgi:hypothetical protein